MSYVGTMKLKPLISYLCVISERSLHFLYTYRNAEDQSKNYIN